MRPVATVVVLLVAGGALYHFLGSSGSSDSRTSTPQHRSEVGEQNGGIAYGDTQHAVLAKLGAPTRKQDACWIYHAQRHTINGMYLGETIDAIRYCFADGPAGGTVVATIHEHLTPNAVARLPKDKRPPGGWTPAFTFMPKAAQHLKY